jgi:hypothetical protein
MESVNDKRGPYKPKAKNEIKLSGYLEKKDNELGKRIQKHTLR